MKLNALEKTRKKVRGGRFGDTALTDFVGVFSARRKLDEVYDAEGRVEGGFFHRLCAAFDDGLDDGLGLIWAVCCFALGVWIYFSLPAEPVWWMLLFAAFVAGGFSVRGYATGSAFLGMAAVACVFAGSAAGALRSAIVAAPTLNSEGSYYVTGFVERTDRRDNGYNLTLLTRSIDKFSPDETPRKIRMLVRAKDAVPEIAAPVSIRARLSPPLSAVRPGGYDYAFRAYFDGVGGSGFAFGSPKPAQGLGAPPLSLRWMRLVADIRQKISSRLLASVGGGDAGALVVALLVGDRSYLSQWASDTLRQVGLAHILAISGLHMALFAGSVYLAVRAFFACFPSLALRYRIDVWAAYAGLLSALFYLVLSGSSTATQRAFVMICLVFIGRILGRRALTFRGVAIAALIVLVVAPEELMAPGFQMSFAAVIALIAAYEELRRRSKRPDLGERNKGRGIFRKLFVWIGGLALTSLIAGLATGVIAAYHFEQVAPLGLIANVLAMPVVTLLIMPAGVLAMAAIPFGLEYFPLQAMRFGLELVLQISSQVRSYTPGGGIVGAQPQGWVILTVAGGLCLCVFPRGFRFLSLAPFAAGMFFLIFASAPDIRISDNARTVGFFDHSGEFRVFSSRLTYTAQNWLRAEGVAEADAPKRLIKKSALACDALACVIKAYPRGTRAHDDQLRADYDLEAGGVRREVADVAGSLSAAEPVFISVVRDPRAFEEDCQRADIIVSNEIAPYECTTPLTADRRYLNESGSLAVTISGLKPSSRTKTLQAPHVRLDEIFSGQRETSMASFEVRPVKNPERPWHAFSKSEAR